MIPVRDYRRLPPLLVLAGMVLFIAGVACWQSGLDLPLHRALRLSSAAWDPPIIALSALGGLRVVGPLGFAIAGWLALRRRWRDALWLALTLAGGRLAVEALKLAVMRPRPPLADRLEWVTSWSFPSAHSAGTMITCLAIALVLGGGARRIVPALAVALAIGWTRAALAVHWPGDVLAGLGFGMAWTGAALYLLPRGRAAPA